MRPHRCSSHKRKDWKLWKRLTPRQLPGRKLRRRQLLSWLLQQMQPQPRQQNLQPKQQRLRLKLQQLQPKLQYLRPKLQIPEAMPDYSKAENWAYFDPGEQKVLTSSLICPTVDTRDEYNMSMNDEVVKKSFLGALNMERGIYEDCTRMFAPYYRQAALKIYDLSPEDREPYLELAYKDVSAAFSWYLENRNNGRPIVLAGFSQGADMCYRILKEYFSDSALQDQLVAVYAIGWPMTEEMISLNPQIKPAAAEDDTGVVVTFECESEDLAETFINPIGQKGISINPLNWVTDSTPADKSLNAGACFTDYSGGIRREVTGLCGCYIDPERGVLKVTDVTPEEFPPILPILPEGSYHLYDYQFFFRNLQQNVDCRINSYLRNKTKDKE